jgi:hypothetical protein
MTKKIKILNIISGIVLLLCFNTAVLVYADANEITNMKFDTCKTLPGSAGCSTTGTGQPGTLSTFAGKAIGIMLQLVAVLGIAVAVYGGFRMIISQGNDTKIQKGTRAFTEAIIGIVIVLLAYVMISFIQGLIVH